MSEVNEVESAEMIESVEFVEASENSQPVETLKSVEIAEPDDLTESVAAGEIVEITSADLEVPKTIGLPDIPEGHATFVTFATPEPEASVSSAVPETTGTASEAAEAVENGEGSNSTKTKDHLYKILVIGDLGTGKTSLIKRYVHRFFTQHYRATIGVDFALKVLNWDEHTVIRLQLWDIAGQERYGNMTRVYYKEAVGAFIVFDVTRRTTFESVINWKTDLDSKAQLPDGSPIPCILLANKCDQPKEGLITNSAKMDEYCKNNGFTAWMETSAKDNINVDECAKVLIEKILELDTVINKNKGGEQFSLADDANAQSSRSKCSC
ncbi:RAS oncogene family member Rab32 isoform X2 [Rhynchophorus ferrugineus]|uniref:RAS oncogene family member Rab32 isoform X2 n=1 Tax=Rhynchophorus ferrugineus TaxID=354439 RepID=UPI003FCE38A9